MDFDKIAMVQAETLFVGKLEGNKNFLFCQNSALMVGNSVRFHGGRTVHSVDQRNV
jgi:hypothetical protein